MKRLLHMLARFQSATVLCCALLPQFASAVSDDCTLDFRYAPPQWQTAICLPDDWEKTLVSKDGALLYDFSKKAGFATKLSFAVDGGTRWQNQELLSPRIPIVRTIKRAGNVDIQEEVFAVTSLPSGAGKPRNDVLLVTLKNAGGIAAEVTPQFRIESKTDLRSPATKSTVELGGEGQLFSAEPWERVEQEKGGMVLMFPPLTISPHGEHAMLFTVTHGPGAVVFPKTLAEARQARKQGEKYWQKLALPYGHIEVPDPAVQGLLDSCVRNIFQAREIKKGLPAFQVGPTVYRGLWVVDGSFLLEAMTYLGRTNDTRNGIKYLMSFQREDGGFMLMDRHWKETGIVLWALYRHAQLTNDKEWLRSIWPDVERAFAFIRKMRTMPATDAPNANLIPDGFSDGGLAGAIPEYTNIYWTMAGLRAAVDAARWLGKDAEAADWEKQYHDFVETFRRAAKRDLRKDPLGNEYVPIKMNPDDTLPQRAQWAFLHAVFPGKVFAADDPIVTGNMAMLKAVECQHLVLDTGWLHKGIWTYFASFYGHAWLWLGDGQKAAETLYAFGNHASPLMVWREEQMPVGQGDATVGDMPHNWASAEFIRLTRHMLALERGKELHLFEGFPAAWTKPGATTAMHDVLTDFGPLSFEFRVSKDGSTGTLKLTPPKRNKPEKIVLHLDHWSAENGTIDLPVDKQVSQKVRLRSLR